MVDGPHSGGTGVVGAAFSICDGAVVTVGWIGHRWGFADGCVRLACSPHCSLPGFKFGVGFAAAEPKGAPLPKGKPNKPTPAYGSVVAQAAELAGGLKKPTAEPAASTPATATGTTDSPATPDVEKYVTACRSVQLQFQLDCVFWH